MRLGLIGISNNHSSLVSKIIAFFTKSKYSHSFITTFPVGGIETVQEGTTLCQLVPFDRNYKDSVNESYILFKVSEEYVSKDQIVESLKICFQEFSGAKYGYLQLLWFVYRWFWEQLGFDVRKNKNWLSDGVICSELVYWYLYHLGPIFQYLLKDFNPDTIQPQDLLTMFETYPEIFEFVERKDIF